MTLFNRSARSLRLRLLVGTLVWIVATLGIAGWGLSGLFQQHIVEQLRDALTIHLEQLTANLTVDPEGKPALSGKLSDPRLHRPYSGLYWQLDLVNDNGETSRRGLLRSRSLWDSVLTVADDSPTQGMVHAHRVAGPNDTSLEVIERIVYPADAPEQRVRLIVAADAALISEPVERFTGLLSAALVILGLGLVAAAVMQVVIGLRPLGQLRQSLMAVREGRAQRIDAGFPQEIQPLVDDFNAVLRHNAHIVEQARTRAGNLAHALKTPLTILANAANRPDDKLPQRVSEQVAVARRQVNHHLARARAAAAVGIPGVRSEVRPLIESLLRVMEHLHHDRSIEGSIHDNGVKPVFRGEKQDLQEMLGNLLENAWKWAGSRVEISFRSDAERFTVVIDDDGPGLAPEQRQAVLARGVRADEQVPGSGLGLAIVTDLAKLYDGVLSLEESPLGGLRVRLTLSAAGA